MKNFNNFINEDNNNFRQWSDMINEIVYIMKVLKNIDCEIECPTFKIFQLVYKYGYNVNVNYDYGEYLDSSRLTSLTDEYIEIIHDYLIKKYDYILNGKDMGLL